MAGIVRDRTSDAAKRPRPGDSQTRARNGAAGDACRPAPAGAEPRVAGRSKTVRGEDPSGRATTRGGVPATQQPRHPRPKGPTSGTFPQESVLRKTRGRVAPLGNPGVDVGPS